MMRPVPVILLLLLALGLGACGDDAPSSALTGELRFVKSGGFAGDHVELIVQPDGRARLTSLRGGERTFALAEEERQAVADAAQNLPDADSTAAKPAPDAFVYTVEYGGSTAKTDDPNLGKSGFAPLVGELQKILEAHKG